CRMIEMKKELVNFTVYHAVGITPHGQYSIRFGYSCYFLKKVCSIEPMNSLCNCNQIELIAGKGGVFCRFCPIHNVVCLVRMLKLLTTYVGCEYLFEMLCQYLCHLPIAGGAIPGYIKLFYMVENKFIQ